MASTRVVVAARSTVYCRVNSRPSRVLVAVVLPPPAAASVVATMAADTRVELGEAVARKAVVTRARVAFSTDAFAASTWTPRTEQEVATE